jgi:hypothetical protein
MILGSVFFLVQACSKFTEITPKGSNILNRVSDLDLLMNFDYSYNATVRDTALAARTTAQTAFQTGDAEVLVNDIYPRIVNVPNLISAGVKSLDYALVTYDETVDRKTLAITDVKYEKLYFIINNVCNVVLKNADGASGDRVKASQLKAEAYIIRAWMHYLLVNFYAKAYNPATAATDGGIPYVKEDNVIAVPNQKSTVAEVYKNIVADIDAAFQLGSLPAIPVNNMRVGQGFAYAVRAKVLLSMRDYAGALAAANASLAINSSVYNDRLYAPVGTAAFAKAAVTAPENLFYAAYTIPLLAAPSLEILNNYYEPGNIIHSYIKPYYPSGNPFNAVTGSVLWFSQAGSYNINSGGLTTSDTYLVKAECLARSGPQQNLVEAMRIINEEIRMKRIHSSNYAPLAATTEAQAIAVLKKVSRIEFLFTYKNFLNIKRWNTEEAYKETITRTINGVTYSLKPESSLWIFPFPQSGTAYNPYLTQNY